MSSVMTLRMIRVAAPKSKLEQLRKLNTKVQEVESRVAITERKKQYIRQITCIF